MKCLGRGTQLNKLFLWATDHLGLQLKNILLHGTFLKGMLHSFSQRILKIMYCYSSQSQSHLMNCVVISVMWQEQKQMLSCQAWFSHKSKICPWFISTVWKHPLLDKVFMHNVPQLLGRADCLKERLWNQHKVNSKKWTANVIHCFYCTATVS